MVSRSEVYPLLVLDMGDLAKGIQHAKDVFNIVHAARHGPCTVVE